MRGADLAPFFVPFLLLSKTKETRFLSKTGFLALWRRTIGRKQRNPVFWTIPSPFSRELIVGAPLHPLRQRQRQRARQQFNQPTNQGVFQIGKGIVIKTGFLAFSR